MISFCLQCKKPLLDHWDIFPYCNTKISQKSGTKVKFSSSSLIKIILEILFILIVGTLLNTFFNFIIIASGVAICTIFVFTLEKDYTFLKENFGVYKGFYKDLILLVNVPIVIVVFLVFLQTELYNSYFMGYALINN
jgi:hypothetical protein